MQGRNGREVVRLAEGFVDRTQDASLEKTASASAERGWHSADDLAERALSDMSRSDWNPEALRALATVWQKIQPLPKGSALR